MLYSSTALLALLTGTASAVVGDYQQCMFATKLYIRFANIGLGGGINWTGEKECTSGAGCVVIKYVIEKHMPIIRKHLTNV